MQPGLSGFIVQSKTRGTVAVGSIAVLSVNKLNDRINRLHNRLRASIWCRASESRCNSNEPLKLDSLLFGKIVKNSSSLVLEVRNLVPVKSTKCDSVMVSIYNLRPQLIHEGTKCTFGGGYTNFSFSTTGELVLTIRSDKSSDYTTKDTGAEKFDDFVHIIPVQHVTPNDPKLNHGHWRPGSECNLDSQSS